MKTKTINTVISKKVGEWISSIKDESLQERLHNGVIVTGGCITSMLLNEDINDYDIYLTDKQLVKDVSNYYCKVFNDHNTKESNAVGSPFHAWVLDGEDVALWKDGKAKLNHFAFNYPDTQYTESLEWDSDKYEGSSGVSGMVLNTDPERIKVMINSDGIANNTTPLDEADDLPAEAMEKEGQKPYQPVFLSNNAITLSGKIQIVIRFYGDAEKIHENYDFAHCTNYWTRETGLVTNVEALEAILSKTLVYKGSKYPLTSVIRSRKFIKRGWNINAGQYLKMCMQISNLDLTNIYTLEDQLVGVDSLYFMEFIKKLMLDIENGKKDKSTLSDNTYVMSVVDKIF